LSHEMLLKSNTVCFSTLVTNWTYNKVCIKYCVWRSGKAPVSYLESCTFSTQWDLVTQFSVLVSVPFLVACHRHWKLR